MLKILHSDLPIEAHQTLKEIEKGEPFRYVKDGVVFRNRERKLPVQKTNYYREFTVYTPNVTDRGAKRIVVGENGEKFYTDDHYQSFKEIVE